MIDLHVFACGHGDTILVRLPNDRTVLIDCCLSKSTGALSRFLEFLANLGISRLDYIFQTHPDIDHFLGMTDVLEHFTKDQRSIGTWCDAGVNAQQVRPLVMTDRISRRHYDKLQSLLDKLHARGFIESFYEISDQHFPVSPKETPGVAFVPIAPSATRKRSLFRTSLEALNDDQNVQLPSNALSVVLVLCVQLDGTTWNFLLTADSEPEDLRIALSNWDRYATAMGFLPTIHGTKVSHHGSSHSHVAELCRGKRDSAIDRVAVISAGTRPGLPHCEVLRDYLREEWIVLITTKRNQCRTKSHPFEIAGRRRHVETKYESHDIQITWCPESGMTWNPIAARLAEDDCDEYSLRAF